MSSSIDFDTPDLPSFDDVRAAAARLKGQAMQTPLLESPVVNRRLGLRLLIKAEPLQRTGSFKFRGAYNRLVQFTAEERARGVVAFSSGNHAQGIAAAAEILGIPATIVMPADAPGIKLANTRSYGATVVTYDRWTEDREAVAARVASEHGGVIVKPFDEKEIIAGQGTVGLEIFEQAMAAGVRIDALIACASGGGLIAGCALAARGLSPTTRVYSAEPAGFDDHARSLAVGKRLSNAPGQQSICDALLSPMPGEITFALNRWLLSGGLVVDDAAVRRAMRVAFHDFKLVIEPGGAVALAAILEGKLPAGPKVVAVVASGGNVDPAFYAEILGGD